MSEKQRLFIPDDILSRIVPGANEKNYAFILKKLEEIDINKVYVTTVLDHTPFVRRKSCLYREITSSSPYEFITLEDSKTSEIEKRFIPEDILSRIAMVEDYQAYLMILKKFAESYERINNKKVIYFSNLNGDIEINSTMSLQEINARNIEKVKKLKLF